MSSALKPISVVAKLLGLGGLIPFVTLTAALVLGVSVPGISDLPQALVNYAAIIVSFIGAVHWGVAVRDDQLTDQHFIYSVVPALLAWALMFVPAKWALTGMAAVIVIAYLVDRSILLAHVRAGYASLRLLLTLVVTASLLIASLAL